MRSKLTCSAPYLAVTLALALVPSVLLAVENEPGTNDHRKVRLDPQVQAVLDKVTASGTISGMMTPKDIDQARKAYLTLRPFEGTPETVFKIDDRTIPGPGGKLPIRIYTPRDGAGLPVLIYFHGGIFTTGSLETHDTLLRALANRSNCMIVSVGYRLAPENPYPAAVEDAYAATKWVAINAGEIGADAQRIAVGGDGAGGNLAAVVAQMSRDRGGPHLRYQVLIYPYTSASMMTVSWWEYGDGPVLSKDGLVFHLGHYTTPTTDFRDPYVSPLAAAHFSGLPPAFIVTAEYDPARDEAEQYGHQLNDDGVKAIVTRYPGMVHGFFQMQGALDAARKCMDEVAKALREALGS